MSVTGVSTALPEDRAATPAAAKTSTPTPPTPPPAEFNLTQANPDQAPTPAPEPTRTVAVILPGFSSAGHGESSASALRDALLAQGIPAENIIVPQSHYPNFNENVTPAPPPDYSQGLLRGAWHWLTNRTRNLCVQGYNLYRNVRLYCQYTDPNSPESRQAYQDVHDLLKLAPGERVNLNFVGYSGGGQESVTLAKIAESDPRVRRVNRIITLGSPMMVNRVRPDVAITSYVSPRDRVLVNTARLPLVHYTPPNADANDRVRTVDAHHTQYYVMPEVLRQVYQDLTANQPPLVLPAPRQGNPAPVPGSLPMPAAGPAPETISLRQGADPLQGAFPVTGSVRAVA